MMRALAGILMLALLLLGQHGTATAAGRHPLLIEGKTTLYQRVLARPRAVLRASPSMDSPVGATLTPFDLFYVYGKQDGPDGPWLEVGRTLDGTAQGWLTASATIDWRQTIVVAFANPALSGGRALLFDGRDKLMQLVESEMRVPLVEQWRQQADAGAVSPDSGVVAIQPENYIDIERQFYLLPILEHEAGWLSTGAQAQILKVASIPLQADPLQQRPSREELMADFNIGVVFVIDTTISMDPYIERTHAAVKQLLDRIRATPIGARAGFGIVAFRDDPARTPGLEYRFKQFLDLAQGHDPDKVLAALGDVQAARVSSVGFSEDSMGGLLEAIEHQGWEKYSGRVIVLITDAGPLAAGDPQRSTDMLPDEIRERAKAAGIWIYALHLLTPAGGSDHASAAAAYGQLASFDGQSLYQEVPGGGVQAFGTAIDQLAGSMERTIDNMLNQHLNDPGPPGATGAESADRVGLAMQLAYLGQRERTQAPEVIEAWLLDKELRGLDQPALEVRLLLSKTQFATMRDVVQALVDGFDGDRNAQIDPVALFDQLRDAVARIAREPERLAATQFQTLGDAIGEYLDGLPYTSEVMGVTATDWAAMGGARQREIIDGLKSKLALYERYHNTPQLWTKLYEGAPDGESVLAIPLTSLP